MSPSHRRKEIIDRMEFLEAQGISCKGCVGTCCTFEANSMMVTPVEALDLMEFLKGEGLLNSELKSKCEETVRRYRLDSSLGNGRRSFLRRTYTCPFFFGAELGCPLPRSVKPYGCLAFNAHHPELKAGNECFSEVQLLERREAKNREEAEANRLVQTNLGLSWNKTSIPEAILDLWDR